VSDRRWQVCKSTAGEWLSFDINATTATNAWLTYHRSQPEALAATCGKIKSEAGR
jgi:hypothetical protein